MVLEDLEDLDDPRSLWVLQGRVDLVYRGVRGSREFLVIRANPLLRSLQNDWWRSRRLGRPSVLVDRVDQIVLVVRGFLNFLRIPSHPLSRCSQPLLSGLEVHPVRADLEVPAFLEILAIQTALVFLLDQLVREVHHYPSLLWIRSAPPVRGILGLQAVR